MSEMFFSQVNVHQASFRLRLVGEAGDSEALPFEVFIIIVSWLLYILTTK